MCRCEWLESVGFYLWSFVHPDVCITTQKDNFDGPLTSSQFSIFFNQPFVLLFPSGTIWIPLPIQTKKKENEKRARITDPTRASRAKDEIFHPTKHHARFTSFASPPAESILYEPYIESISWFSWMITVGFQKHFIRNARLMALDDDNWVSFYFVVFAFSLDQEIQDTTHK